MLKFTFADLSGNTHMSEDMNVDTSSYWCQAALQEWESRQYLERTSLSLEASRTEVINQHMSHDCNSL